MRFQCVAFFNSNKVEAGFSETYYADSVDHVTVASQFGTLLTKRLAMIPNDCQIVFAKVSDMDTLGDSKIVDDITYPALGTYAGAGECEPLSVGVLVRSEATPAHRGLKVLRAIPDPVVNGQVYVTTLAYDTAFTDWKNVLLADPWRLRIKDPAAPLGFRLVGFTDIRNERRITHRNVGRPFGTAVGRHGSRSGT